MSTTWAKLRLTALSTSHATSRTHQGNLSNLRSVSLSQVLRICASGARLNKLTQVASALADQISNQQLRYQCILSNQYSESVCHEKAGFLLAVSKLANTCGMHKLDSAAMTTLLEGTVYLEGHQHDVSSNDYSELHMWVGRPQGVGEDPEQQSANPVLKQVSKLGSTIWRRIDDRIEQMVHVRRQRVRWLSSLWTRCGGLAQDWCVSWLPFSREQQPEPQEQQDWGHMLNSIGLESYDSNQQFSNVLVVYQRKQQATLSLRLFKDVSRNMLELLIPASKLSMHRVDKVLLLASISAASVMPFARSASYGLAHPQLANAVMGSLFLMVGYRIWCSLSEARTQYKLASAERLMMRLQAADDAVLPTLLSQACEDRLKAACIWMAHLPAELSSTTASDLSLQAARSLHHATMNPEQATTLDHLNSRKQLAQQLLDALPDAVADLRTINAVKNGAFKHQPDQLPVMKELDAIVDMLETNSWNCHNPTMLP
eukprot:TRINITY_DN4299_c0_g1_i2.p1 TRINITY_DN4299_c0_g1~~TRINITY_DN4299_c0_g1_i2.p1  ORF type:complete len:486 (-),score=84.64 TRINITY_DN4299_c0_g1_i2:388-1845(-)